MPDRFADAVVVAAGASRRMGGGVDKLAAPLAGRPLLAWSVAAMAASRAVRRVIVVASAGGLEALRGAPWLVETGATLVAGGERRSDSVLAGLNASDAEVVLVHDGARPLATPLLADAVALAAAEHGAAVPVVPVTDSLKRSGDGFIAAAVERSGMLRAQTPQGARRELLIGAFRAAGGTAYSDEAALLEASGVAVAMVAGEAMNVKVTEPDDLELVRALVIGRSTAAETRIGVGQDSHPFGPADGLWLGGIHMEEAPRLYGHSDGDVALHALGTAILAACGMGDLGRLFPATDPRNSGAASTGLLADVLARAGQAGWQPSAAQVSLVGARPRLGAGRLDQMRHRLAELLGLADDEVAVSASSGNLAGPEGAGRAISATALVTMRRQPR